MNDTPGWASPGSAPSDGQDTTVPRPAAPADDTDSTSKWSTAQPPAGQWSPPSAPGPGPAAPGPTRGWGGPPPGGGPGWGGPQAAKPGVIPLRPLSVGEILDGAVSTLRAHWRTVLSVSLAVSVVSQIGDILLRRYLLPEPVVLDPNATPSELLSQTTESAQSQLAADIPSLAIMVICTLFTTAILTVVISRSVLGRPVTLADAWQEARPRLPKLLGFTLLLPLMSALVLVVGMLPGLLIGSTAGAALSLLGATAAFVVVIWLMVRFSLTSPALMLERRGIIPSMRRSAKLVSGAWWRTFGILALTLLLSFLLSLVIAIPFAIIGTAVDGDGLTGWPFLIVTGIGAVIASTITYPISAGVTVLLYVDQRIRREALDLELARAAGVPGYGTQQPGRDLPGS
ncbi:glycerophosphoryl diester phosphodiesterase membrane domain-containing protein [Streptomyces sp. NPDC127033]|uniref:DUF7544 domain-containing protein n=1 Tax=Streptomyces sp. NPDC127033 TaxID=3347110 RepID=UPI003648361E